MVTCQCAFSINVRNREKISGSRVVTHSRHKTTALFCPYNAFFDHVRCSACPCHGLYSAQSGTAARTSGPPGTCPISGIRCCRPCPGVSQFTQDRLYAGALSEIIFPRNCRAPGRRSCCSGKTGKQAGPTAVHSHGGQTRQMPGKGPGHTRL